MSGATALFEGVSSLHPGSYLFATGCILIFTYSFVAVNDSICVYQVLIRLIFFFGRQLLFYIRNSYSHSHSLGCEFIIPKQTDPGVQPRSPWLDLPFGSGYDAGERHGLAVPSGQRGRFGHGERRNAILQRDR